MRIFILLCFIIINGTLNTAISQINSSTIEIRTRFASFVGKPSWLLTIRDVDSGETYPHLFDISKGENNWVIPTHGYNYLITVSNLRFNTYDAKYNDYRQYEIKNFCGLESRGRIVHGKSALIIIDGNLSKNSNGYRCKIQRF